MCINYVAAALNNSFRRLQRPGDVNRGKIETNFETSCFLINNRFLLEMDVTRPKPSTRVAKTANRNDKPEISIPISQ